MTSMRSQMTSRRVAAGLGPALLILAAAAAPVPAQTTVVILVRHAEQETGPQDPSLSALGRARADSLAAMVERAGVSAIYHTTLRRTTETAGVAARALNIETTPLGVRPGQSVAEHAQEVATHIMANHAGKTVLVVGHSNTVPLIAGALGIESPPAIRDTEFSHVFVIIKVSGQPARLLHTRYGA